jgi:hypothetical protein
MDSGGGHSPNHAGGGGAPQGGPQIIRAHITGQAQGKNGGVRSKACSAPPEELKENWLRPELSKSEKEQQKVDRADAKKLKQQHKAVAGVAGAGRAASSKKNKLQHDSDDVLLTLEVRHTYGGREREPCCAEGGVWLCRMVHPPRTVAELTRVCE